MDWIRRNWPDLLIGVALVAVIAMIIATLLSGGSLLSLVRQGAPADQTTPQVATPLGPDETATEGASPGEEAAAAGTPGAATETQTPAGAADDAPGDASLTGDIDPFIPDAGPAQTGGGAPLVADGDAPGDGNGVNGTGDAVGSAADDTDTDVTTDSAIDAAADTAAETDQVDVGPDPAPASETGQYRVAAGAIGTQAGADDLAQSYRDEGYRVEVEPQGDLFLIWVGPYETEADAEGAAASIRDAGGDALVYTFGGAGQLAENLADGDGGDSAVPSGTALDELTDDAADEAADNAAPGEVDDVGTGVGETGTADPSATEPGAAEEGAADPAVPDGQGDGAQDNEAQVVGAAVGSAAGGASALPAAPAGQRYLQVGAFANATSAEPLRSQLEQLGFDVTSSEADTGLTRLYVGPFGEAQLSQTQTTLSSQGIDSFPVAQ